MILSFANKETEKIFKRDFSRKRPHEIQPLVKKKLDILNAAHDLNDLRVPPGNQEEPLFGNRAGQHSIKVNDQWRLYFSWIQNNAYDCELTDFH
ncbi:MAG: type II toxin-antitoxin system RelE/ParE family toxin [Chloroflexi bacterium]|nr:type II toxin-antitoxin system RelE/ParE family toxin [Chloroflexota bacterium]